MELRERVREGLNRLHFFFRADTRDDVTGETAEDEGLLRCLSEFSGQNGYDITNDRREGVAVVKQNGAMRWHWRQRSTASANVIAVACCDSHKALVAS